LAQLEINPDYPRTQADLKNLVEMLDRIALFSETLRLSGKLITLPLMPTHNPKFCMIFTIFLISSSF